MYSHMIARRFGVTCLLILMGAIPVLADSSSAPNINSDMVLSGPSVAEPMRLTIHHPKDKAMHVTIITDAVSGGSVDFNAPANADPTIAYSFPSNAARNIQILDGQGSKIWDLLDGKVSVSPITNVDSDRSHAVLTQLDRAYSILPVALEGMYTLHPNPTLEFLSTTDFVRTDPAGVNRHWAHHHRPAPASSVDTAPSATTIVITPSHYVPEPDRSHETLQ